MEINEESLWAIPVFDFVESFNSRNSDLFVECNPASVMNYIHLFFRPSERREDHILYISVTHPRGYNISGSFNILPVQFLPPLQNKERASRIVRDFLKYGFHVLDEENAVASQISPKYTPSLVHRYSKEENRNEYTNSELFFTPIQLGEFARNTLEAEVLKFQSLLN